MEEKSEQVISQPVDEDLEKGIQQAKLSKPDMGFIYMQIEQALETYRTQFHLLTS